MVGVDLGVNAVPIVGEPVAYGTGFIALLLVLISRYIIGYPLTLAHEGGHMLANLFLLRGNDGWELEENAEAGTKWKNAGGWIRKNLGSFIGYTAPPLLGLGAAALIAAGNPWAVLLATIVLCILAVGLSRNGLAFIVPALIVTGLTWLLLAGSSALQAAVAVGLAWVLLFGGLLQTIRNLSGRTGDGDALFSRTWIPNAIWNLIWLFIAVVALIVGGQLLLRPGYMLG
ncbi:M50 family metallopeptidase [Actinomycetospora straminea]|uniref:M50 family metallopeptidase n=1 Tax=Actinomycetospora straminea TaxID=663607 RepID=A0ABP9ETJ7_9PSEU|nr:M50 family metallopeptidase [Actinomycetospora straminea]MDD7931527.1 M50 family metallopeptidase [Actinomycetospora straminea]